MKQTVEGKQEKTSYTKQTNKINKIKTLSPSMGINYVTQNMGILSSPLIWDSIHFMISDIRSDFTNSSGTSISTVPGTLSLKFKSCTGIKSYFIKGRYEFALPLLFVKPVHMVMCKIINAVGSSYSKKCAFVIWILYMHRCKVVGTSAS